MNGGNVSWWRSGCHHAANGVDLGVVGEAFGEALGQLHVTVHHVVMTVVGLALDWAIDIVVVLLVVAWVGLLLLTVGCPVARRSVENVLVGAQQNIVGLVEVGVRA